MYEFTSAVDVGAKMFTRFFRNSNKFRRISSHFVAFRRISSQHRHTTTPHTFPTGWLWPTFIIKPVRKARVIVIVIRSCPLFGGGTPTAGGGHVCACWRQAFPSKVSLSVSGNKAIFPWWERCISIVFEPFYHCPWFSHIAQVWFLVLLPDLLDICQQHIVLITWFSFFLYFLYFSLSFFPSDTAQHPFQVRTYLMPCAAQLCIIWTGLRLPMQIQSV